MTEVIREQGATNRKWLMMGLLSLAEFLAMAVWFSASSVVTDLTTLMRLDASGQSWLTMTVQIGFVVGALAASIFTLADRVSSRRLFVFSIFGAVAATALIPLFIGIPLFSIRLLPTLVDWVSWRWAFSFLAIGPLVGIWAMQKLQAEQHNTQKEMQ